MKFLESVNNDLKESVAAAALDYVITNHLLKNYYAKRELGITDENLTAETKSKLQELTGNLQYMDIFSQRVYHLVLAHQKMTMHNMAQVLTESIFHLHVFQALTIELDLIRSISAIKSSLADLKDHFIAVGKIDWMDDDIFNNMHIIKEKLQTTIAALRLAGGETKHLPLPTLNEEQITILSSLYSMESERVVLNWFLNSMPDGTWEQLMQHYEAEINKVEDDNMELF